MEKVERIIERLPRFYIGYDKKSTLFRFINGFAKTLDEEQKDLFAIMRSHWVDTAYGVDLDYLGSLFNLKRRSFESDDRFRRRIKSAIIEFRGGGTIDAILTQTKNLLDLKVDEKLELIENPPIKLDLEKTVKSGDMWSMSSMSLNDEDAIVTLTVEEGDFEVSEVLDPTIIDLDNNLSIKYRGTIKAGQKLILKDGKAELDGVDVSDKISTMKIPRKSSRWKYQESISMRLGRYDDARFDEHVFEKPVPAAFLHFEWNALLLAAFELKVPSATLTRNGISKEDLEEVVNAIKATGIKSIITVKDKV